MTEFKVPELGESVAGGDVMNVMVKVGDTIARDQPVLELETDKATIEVPSSVAGVVKEVRVKKGDKIKVGAVVLTVDDAAAGNGAGAAEKAAPKAEAKAEEPKAAAAPEEKPEPKAEAKPEAKPEAKSDAKPPADHKVLPMPSRNQEPAKQEPPTRNTNQEPGTPRNPEPGTRNQEPAQRAAVAPASPAVRRLAR